MNARRNHPSALMLALVAAAVRTTASLALVVGVMLSTASCVSGPRNVRFADVDDHRIAYQVLGAGGPTIVMIAGLGDDMSTFGDVASDLATTATVILYDRAGYGGSGAPAGVRDAEAAARELSAVLEQSGVGGPYVLVGHSLGGLYAEYFAAQHPDQVLGVVLAESRPADFTRRCEDTGISSCSLPASMAWTLPEGGRAELTALATTVRQVEYAHTAHGIPMLVLSRPTPANPSAFDILWSAAQLDLAARYPGARHLIAGSSGHYLHIDRRAWFVESVRTFTNETHTRAAT